MRTADCDGTVLGALNEVIAGRHSDAHADQRLDLIDDLAALANDCTHRTIGHSDCRL